jgi:RNA polymerase sigma-B factor
MSFAHSLRVRDGNEFLPLFRQLADGTAQTRRSAIRNRLVTEYLPVAERIARRYRDRGQPQEDLNQVARMGLIHAVDRFDPYRGADFLSFAVPTITGEVRRYFRDATWALRVPRRLKELYAAVTACTDDLAHRLGRSPRCSEIGAALDIPVEEVYAGLRVGFAYHTEHLETGPGHDEERVAGSALGHTDERIELVENREALRSAMAELPAREASIVLMRFFEDLTQSQIAQRLGISQMHVSRLLTASLTHLREIFLGDA